MKTFFKKILIFLAGWLFKPKAKAYTCCSDEKKEKEKKPNGGFAY